MSRLEGKIAIITGGSTGQGASHARRIVAEGGKVMIGDIQDEAGEALAEEIGDNAIYQHLDVTSEESWQDALTATKETFGLPTVLVNNAGITCHQPIVGQDLDKFQAVLGVSLTGTMLGIKVIAPAMKEAGGGSIINLSSVSGLQGFTTTGAYCAAKWGVRGLSRVAALELGRDKIRVNVICPGPIDTPMLAKVDVHDEEMWKGRPIQRVGRPDEISNMVVFLASEESSFSTGADFIADGGVSAGDILFF
ncbi:SDR family oxidoreductase [Parasphingorhabdus sp.]|uniref:SDR family oxidoreductase n=1 Tax=Parasphingorhabdus sp. TaxID=2709688 RepID=UPI003A93645C